MICCFGSAISITKRILKHGWEKFLQRNTAIRIPEWTDFLKNSKRIFSLSENAIYEALINNQVALEVNF
jgi:hypothetical protein